jgi:hypothetical protein
MMPIRGRAAETKKKRSIVMECGGDIALETLMLGLGEFKEDLGNQNMKENGCPYLRGERNEKRKGYFPLLKRGERREGKCWD